jgi:hypothetical protein
LAYDVPTVNTRCHRGQTPLEIQVSTTHQGVHQKGKQQSIASSFHSSAEQDQWKQLLNFNSTYQHGRKQFIFAQRLFNCYCRHMVTWSSHLADQPKI